MSVYFLESSSLTKRYVNEIGSNWVKGIVTDPQHTIVCSQIGEVEVSSAFCRRYREGSITTTERDQLIATLHHDCSATYHALNVTDDILTEAVRLLKAYPLRTYDAIQLATALVANWTLTQQELPLLIFVCADGRLLQAAIAEGLSVEDQIVILDLTLSISDLESTA